MDDEHPSSGLVPEPGAEMNLRDLGYETPDAFDEPMDEDDFENDLPEEGVSPEDVAFEQDLEADLEDETTANETTPDAAGPENPREDGDGNGDTRVTPYRGDTDFEQELEDQDIERYGEDER